MSVSSVSSSFVQDLSHSDRVRLLADAYTALGPMLPSLLNLGERVEMRKDLRQKLRFASRSGIDYRKCFAVTSNGVVKVALKKIKVKKFLKSFKDVDPLEASRRLAMELYGMHYLRHANIHVALLTRFNPAKRNIYLYFERTTTLADVPRVSLPNDCIYYWPEEIQRYITRSVLNALAYLREFRIVHGNVNPKNVVITYDGRVKLANFENAKYLPFGERKFLRLVATPETGTRPLPPGRHRFGLPKPLYRTDIFNTGLLCIFMSIGEFNIRIPFVDEDAFEEMFYTHHKTVVGGLKLILPHIYERLEPHLSGLLQDFLDETLVFDVRQQSPPGTLRDGVPFVSQMTDENLDYYRQLCYTFLTDRKVSPEPFFDSDKNDKQPRTYPFLAPHRRQKTPKELGLDATFMPPPTVSLCDGDSLYRITFKFTLGDRKINFEADVFNEERQHLFRVVYELLNAMPDSQLFEFDMFGLYAALEELVNDAYYEYVQQSTWIMTFTPQTALVALPLDSPSNPRTCCITVRLVLRKQEPESQGHLIDVVNDAGGEGCKDVFRDINDN